MQSKMPVASMTIWSIGAMLATYVIGTWFVDTPEGVKLAAATTGKLIETAVFLFATAGAVYGRWKANRPISMSKG